MLNVDKSESSKLQEDPGIGRDSRFCECYLKELDLVLTVKIRENFPYDFGRGRGEVTI